MDGLLPFLPALVVFVIGVISHRIIPSLSIGILLGGLIATSGSIFGSFNLIAHRLLMNCETDKWSSWDSFTCSTKLFIVGFIFASSALFTLVKKSNGIKALVSLASRRIKDSRGAETTSLLLSHGLFIDGCLSSITVSSIMRPILDRFKIPRVKTAFLADSMSGPLVAICPFSCFTALVIGLLSNNGVHPEVEKGTILLENPNSIYFLTIPYILYSLTIIATLWLIVRSRISLELMKKYENPFTDDSLVSSQSSSSAKITDFFIPILLFPLFIAVYVFIMDKGSTSIWQLMTRTPISFVLFASSTSALIVSVAYFRLSGRFKITQSLGIIIQNCTSSFRSALVIVLAWTLADILKFDLKLGKEISSLISESISIAFLPLICFWLSSIVAASLGTSWGTVAIFLPLITPTVMGMQGVAAPATLEQIPILLPSLGAILSGAAFGDHISLLSDSTILSSAGAKCHPVDHFKTQWFYSIPPFAASSAGFLAAGFMIGSHAAFSYTLPLVLSLVLVLVFMIFIHYTSKAKAATSDDKTLS